MIYTTVGIQYILYILHMKLNIFEKMFKKLEFQKIENEELNLQNFGRHLGIANLSKFKIYNAIRKRHFH